MSDLVGNPEDRFSRVEAHFIPFDNNCIVHCDALLPDPKYMLHFIT